jgi:hypothetical protein
MVTMPDSWLHRIWPALEGAGTYRFSALGNDCRLPFAWATRAGARDSRIALYSARSGKSLAVIQEMAAPFPSKPKGMWGSTYQQLCERACNAEMRAYADFAQKAERLLARIDQPRHNGATVKGASGND